LSYRGKMPRKKLVLGWVFVLVLVGWALFALADIGGNQEHKRVPEPAPSPPTISEAGAHEFVGEIPGARELVAIVADKPVAVGPDEKTTETTAAGGERKMQAYVCDGEPQGDAEWFTGQMTDNTLVLTSVSGRTRLQVELTETEATGTVTLADGIPRRFTAPAAREGAGLYEVTIAPDGQRNGTSATGAKDEGLVRPNGEFTTGTIRLPGGEAVDYRTQRTAGYEGVANRSDTYTTIVLPGVEKERGRGGDVKADRPSSNVISNDLVL
jgi:hypothetical protein